MMKQEVRIHNLLDLTTEHTFKIKCPQNLTAKINVKFQDKTGSNNKIQRTMIQKI